MIELWKPVPETDGLFEVSNFGRIREHGTGKMQRRFGIDYRVRGLADRNGVYVVYRGQIAEAHGNIFAWTWGGRKYAHNLADFKRCVDRQKIKEVLNGATW